MWEPGAAEVAGSQFTWGTAAGGSRRFALHSLDQDTLDEDVLEAALVWSQRVRNLPIHNGKEKQSEGIIKQVKDLCSPLFYSHFGIRRFMLCVAGR